ncbi:MMPL family transporter [Lentilactobacillus buchneri]|uniref:MMPL family transporter n=1 Tax=Lentilactobacillus buchneri TaxID=1581 RepID=UPI0010ABAB86|nr:MMPL family transporter [Lentilactobacillus buchneri]TJX99384.1 MMPL family transporter [Lentilactobacillus buchneri]TJY05144.1 MMPL family transporter [Lentilactobacillus buchneri]TJY12680.1 MMPL family transporter [Lentilactobacillus buchneri]TJY15823.1 MMPL family transporter [Lentilactobacillus buchneri]TJY20097.1 MMPL family transporter [Lentilactobacillus buchneri]
MQKFKEKHLLSLIVWIGLILVAIFTLPNISQLVHDKGTVQLPASVQSEVANKIEKKYEGGKNARTLIAVFNNKHGKLSDEQTLQIQDATNAVKNDPDLHIISVTAPSDNQAAKQQLQSKDNSTTQMVMITVPKKDKVRGQTDKILDKIKTPGMRTYVTGSDVLNEDFSTVTEQGLQKTEIIAAIFIFIVLIIVFRSFLIPVISLLTVGVSYLLSLDVVMNLAQRWDFPISNFTQVFLVVVLFGIGTDYNILLYDRFKEEIRKGQGATDAARSARRHAGRTILYSGSSVLIGFAALALAKFSFYRSGVAVAVGVAILLMVLLTLNMFFMSTLGERLFWPSKNLAAHDRSFLWNFLSKFTLSHSFIMVGILIIAALPLLFVGSQKLNFNSADELPNSVQSKAGYNIIQDHYPAGMSGPTTVYIQNKKPLDTQQHLAEIDQLTGYLNSEAGVKSVASVTRPGGTKIDSLYLRSQLESLTNGLNQANQGIKKVQKGLKSANEKLANSNTSESIAQVEKLADGASKLEAGAQQLSQGVTSYTAGVSNLASGSQQLSSGTSSLQSGVGRLSAGSQRLNTGISQVRSQTAKLKALRARMAALQSGSRQLSSGLGRLNSQVAPFSNGLNQITSGASRLNSNSSSLVSGAQSVASGSSQVNSGVQTLNSKMKELQSQMQELQTGLTSANSGLDQVSSGTTTVNKYLKEMQKSYLGNTFYMPAASIKSASFTPSLDAFMSKDRKITKITVVLNSDPSTTKSANRIRTITRDLNAKMKDTSLKNAKVAIGGQSSQTSDLQKIANGDFFRTVVIMLVGIGLALMVVTRSLVQAITIIGTLIVTYMGSLQITKWLSGYLLFQNMLTWNTPFFSFIMLVALGVDYSIFLMMRYRGDAGAIPDVRRRILNSATIIGTVVISAAIILGGTFAALIPSNVLTLIQVAMTVIVGLIILVLTLPIIMSAMVKWTYPYVNDKMYQKSVDKEEKEHPIRRSKDKQ